MDAPQFQRLTEIAVDQVTPDRQGFTLTGLGEDRAEYRLDVHFDMPLDPRTRAVVGELLAQSELVISKRAVAASPAARRDRAHRGAGRRITAD